MGKEKNSGKEVISAQQAEDLKMKEKRKREREVLIILNLCLFVYLIVIEWKFLVDIQHDMLLAGIC